LASEVPGFYTRYLATVKDTLGIAITFSIAKDHYDAYQEIFDKVVATIRVFDQTNSSQKNWTKKKDEGDLVAETAVVPESNPNQDIGQKKKANSGGGLGDTETMALVGIAVVGLLVYLKKKKK
jgi:hypothetical protein